MHKLLRQMVVPMAAASTLALVGSTSLNAFAATRTNLSLTGALTQSSALRDHVKINGHLYAALPRVAREMNHWSQGTRVRVKIDARGRIVAVQKAQDRQTSRVTGTITAVSTNTITVGSTVYPMASNISVRFGPFTLSAQSIPVNSTATLRLNSSGEVTAIWLRSDSNLPRRPMLMGKISAVSTSTITIDGYTLPVTSSTTVKADGQTVPFTDVAANQRALVRLDRSGTVAEILLLNEGTVRGTVTADSASSVTVGGTTYPYANDVNIRYRQYILTPSQLPSGATVVIHLNAMGQAAGVNVLSGVNLPANGQITGSVGSVSANSITINSDTLPLASTLTVTYEGTTSLSNSVTAGETARAWLNHQGQVSHLLVAVTGNLSVKTHH